MNDQKKSILIVEDDVDISKALTIRLKNEGYIVNSAQDAVMATKLAREKMPDLLLLDISIPGGDGFEVAKRVDEIFNRRVKKIFITASKKPGLLSKASRVHANGFIEKPFRSSELLTQIQNAFLYSEPLQA